MISAQNLASLSFLNVSFILEPFLYQRALNKKQTNKTNLSFSIAHERFLFFTLSMGALVVRDAGQLAVRVIEKGDVERWRCSVLI